MIHNPAWLDDLITNVRVILAAANAIAVLEETGGTILTDGTEQTVYVNETPAGVFRPMCVKIDCTNQSAIDTIVLRTYYRIEPAGAYVLQDTLTFAGVVSPELINIELEPNRYGIHVTIEQTVSTQVEFPWEVCYKI